MAEGCQKRKSAFLLMKSNKSEIGKVRKEASKTLGDLERARDSLASIKKLRDSLASVKKLEDIASAEDGVPVTQES